MIARLRSVVERMTRAERVVLVLLAAQPLLWLANVVVVLAIAAPIVVLLVAVPLLILLVVAALMLRARLRRRAANRLNPQAGGLLGNAVGHHGGTRGVVLAETAAPQLRQLADELARRQPVAALVRAGLHSRAGIYRDALALAATAGRFDHRSLLEAAAGSVDGHALWATADAEALLGLVRLTAAHDPTPAEFEALLDVACHLAPRASESARLSLVGILIWRGRREEARRVLATVREPAWLAYIASTDLANPLDGEGEADVASEAAWLASFNALYRSSGVESVVLEGAGDAEPFERLAAPAAVPGTAAGPLISVVMTVFRPGTATRQAVESVRRQSWREWELIIVDDASGPEFDAVLDEFAALDDRIRVLRAARNEGTYARRNDGLDAARGEFVAFHDSDDWSHPRRLEIQARYLEASPSVPGTVTSALRVSSRLRLTQPRGADLRLCEPSLMIRREQVLAAAGYLDPIRRGADVEYRERIGAAVGREVVHVLTAAPLTLMRFDLESLSATDFIEGWSHPARLAYRSSHRHWRAAIRRRGGSLRRGRDEATRPFPAPDHLVGEDGTLHEVDLLVLADLGRGVVDSRSIARLDAAIREHRRAGRRVAVMHSSSLMTGEQERDVDPRILDIVAREGAGLRVLGERVHAQAVVVADPGVLVALPDQAGSLAADRVAIVAPSADSTEFRAAAGIARRRWMLDARWAAELKGATAG